MSIFITNHEFVIDDRFFIPLGLIWLVQSGAFALALAGQLAPSRAGNGFGDFGG
jgi:hypothetical protein